MSDVLILALIFLGTASLVASGGITLAALLAIRKSRADASRKEGK